MIYCTNAIDKYFYKPVKDNKYLFIYNGLKNKIPQTKNRQIIFGKVKYKLLSFIVHRGKIKSTGATCGHYVFYYMKYGNMKYISDSIIENIYDNKFKNGQYKTDYEHPYLMLYERINEQSSGGYINTKLPKSIKSLHISKTIKMKKTKNIKMKKIKTDNNKNSNKKINNKRQNIRHTKKYN